MEFTQKREPTIKEVFYILKELWLLDNDDVNLLEDDEDYEEIGEQYRLNFMSYMYDQVDGIFNDFELSGMVETFYMDDVSLPMILKALKYLMDNGCLEYSA